MIKNIQGMNINYEIYGEGFPIFSSKEVIEARDKLFKRNNISKDLEEAKIMMKLLEYQLVITINAQNIFIEMRDKNNMIIDFEEVIDKTEI